MCVRLCVGTAGLPRKGAGLFLAWKVGLTSLKQYPSQGLLIPLLAADHVNPALSDRAAFPGAANPLVCRGGGDARLPELTSPATKVRTTGQHPGEEAECPSAHLEDPFKDHTCDVRAAFAEIARLGNGRPRYHLSLGPPGALDSLSVKEREISILELNELLKTYIIFGGKCQNNPDLQRGQPGWVGSWADNLASILLCTGDTDVCAKSSGTGGKGAACLAELVSGLRLGGTDERMCCLFTWRNVLQIHPSKPVSHHYS